MVIDQEPMESLPAPDIVGREFVRQYYTLLHEAPEHAHRFYNSNSYFVHGVMSKPAIGQLEIHQKIQQLNFRDCHAKISQVDSQVTLGNGVVVQVSGELSNDGEPMRRFSQTFVLGTQSPKKYYVHNDIFRYQDTLQSDEERGDTPEKDVLGADLPQEVPTPNYFPATSEPLMTPVMPVQQQQQPINIQQPPLNMTVNVNGTGLHHDEPIGPEPVKPLEQSVGTEPSVSVAAPVMNGGPMLNRMIISPSAPPEPTQSDLPRSGPSTLSTSSEDSPPKVEPVNTKDDYGWDDGAQEQSRTVETNELQQPTFANLVKSGRGGRGGMRSVRGGPPGSAGDRGIGGPSPYSSPHGPPQAAASVDLTAEHSSAPLHSSGASVGSSSGENRRHNPYPDTHQVFIGVLPPDTTDEELKAVFSTFGRVVDLRVNPCKNSHGKSNYGFVTFEDAASAAACIQNKPIKLRASGKFVELNVEEKRPMIRGGPVGGRVRGSPRGGPRGGFGGRVAASMSSRSSYPSRR